MNVRTKSRLITSRRYMRRVFARLVRNAYPAGTRLLSVTTSEVGAYRFKHALRYKLTLVRPDGRRSAAVVRGNAPSADTLRESAVANRAQRALARHGFAFGPLRVPAALGTVPSLWLHLYEEIPGVSLERLVAARNPQSRRLARNAGIWLAALHNERMRFGQIRSSAQIERDAGFFRDDAVRYAPEFADRVIRVVGQAVRVQGYVASTFRSAFCVTHGDLNIGNIIAVTDGSTGLIDLGNSVRFDPLSDIGNFLAQLDCASWGEPKRLGNIRPLSRAVLAGYRGRIGRLGSRAGMRIDAHHAWWLLQILAYRFSTDAAYGRRIADRVLTEAERLLAQCGYPVPAAFGKTGFHGLRNALVEQSVMHGFFQRQLHAFFPGSQKIEWVRVAQPHALSTSSYLTRYRITIMAPNGSTSVKNVRGNFIAPTAFRIMQAVYQRPSRRFTTMRPLWFDPRFRYELYEEVRGLPLRMVPIRSSSFAGTIAPIARAVAGLHAVPCQRVPRIPFRQERDMVLRNARIASRYIPRQHSFLSRTASSVIRGERAAWDAPQAIVHNDLQASNIIIDRGTVGLIDYTQSGVANPAIDVGNFIAHLGVMLYGKVGLRRSAVVRGRFVREYLRAYRGRHRLALERSIPVFELRSMLDILAITLTNLGPRHPNGRRYVRFLLGRIALLMTTMHNL